MGKNDFSMDYTTHVDLTTEKNRQVITQHLNQSVRPYTELLIGGLAASTVGCILALLLLGGCYIEWPNPLLVSLCIMGVALPVLLVSGCIVGIRMGLKPISFRRILAFSLAGTLSIGALAAGLEWIYELGYVCTGADYDDYIFVVDDSGSMGSSDPRNRRYSALEALLADMDETHMAGLIRFSDGVNTETAPGILNDAQRQRIDTAMSAAAVSGGTDIQAALNRAVDMIAAARRDGHSAAIILLSDGVSHAVDVKGISDRLNAIDVDICTVALGAGADRNLLRSLSDATGGILLDVSDAEMLRASYHLLSGGTLYRCLLMPRIGADKGNILSMILSVLFLGILGSAISVCLVWMLDTDRARPQLRVGCIASFGGALLHEIGNNLGFGALAREIMLILFGLVLLKYYAYRHDYTSHYNSAGISPDGTMPPENRSTTLTGNQTHPASRKNSFDFD